MSLSLLSFPVSFLVLSSICLLEGEGYACLYYSHDLYIERDHGTGWSQHCPVSMKKRAWHVSWMGTMVLSNSSVYNSAFQQCMWLVKKNKQRTVCTSFQEENYFGNFLLIHCLQLILLRLFRPFSCNTNQYLIFILKEIATSSHNLFGKSNCSILLLLLLLFF